MITREQALNEVEFHRGPCERVVGPRGGVRIRQEVWRRNGRTQTWKSRPWDFSVPVKRGLYAFGRINPGNADEFHAASACPLLDEV